LLLDLTEDSQSDTVVRFPASDPSKVETVRAGMSVRSLALDRPARIARHARVVGAAKRAAAGAERCVLGRL
jgi:hypothetical protein